MWLWTGILTFLSHVSQTSRTQDSCTKSTPLAHPGTSQILMSRFPTQTLTLNPHISSISLLAWFGMHAAKCSLSAESTAVKADRPLQFLPLLFLFFFFFLLFCFVIKTLHKIYCIFCSARVYVTHSHTYGGYVSVTVRTYPFKNCSN